LEPTGTIEPVTSGDNAVLDQDKTWFESHEHGPTRLIATSNSASAPNTSTMRIHASEVKILLVKDLDVSR
jgi:hypothetical protein